MTGIRSIEDIRQRCVIDDITNCWNWGGALTGDGRPSMWVAALGRVGSLGTLFSFIETGEGPKRGTCWAPMVCRNVLCANPGHRKLVSQSEMQKAMRPVLTPLHRARIARGRQAVSLKLDHEKAQLLRTSDRPATHLAIEMGIHPSMACRVRRGESWRELSPFPEAA